MVRSRCRPRRGVSRRSLTLATFLVCSEAWAQSAPTSLRGAVAACCLGDTCQILSQTDCVAGGGFFHSEIAFCVPSVCATGSCCLPGETCQDHVGNNAITKAQCDGLNGLYRGGAICTDDPCDYVGPLPGFEIIELTPGMEGYDRRRPTLNNCGEVVWHMGPDDSGARTDIYLYDNGLLRKLTNAPIAFPYAPDNFPTISDSGMVAYTHWPPPGNVGRHVTTISPATETSVVVYDDVSVPAGVSISMNALGHLTWHLTHGESACDIGNYRAWDIWMFDGEQSRLLVHDRLTNQSPDINDQDEIVFGQLRLPCACLSCWVSDIRYYSEGGFSSIPSAAGASQRQSPRINESGMVVVDSSNRSFELWDGTASVVVGDGANPSINNLDEMTASHCCFDDGPHRLLWHQTSPPRRISSDEDLVNHIDNHSASINDAGEIAWTWKPNGGSLPSGTRLMRRIRTGDYDLNGAVDRADFGEFKYCFTGSAATDHLCQCRFYDIDHDRDVDMDDYTLFLSNYTGTIEDCNGNAVSDFDDILNGTAPDCNVNGVPDSCDIGSQSAGGSVAGQIDPPQSPLGKEGGTEARGSGGASVDDDGNGVPDECQCRAFQAVHVNPNYDLFNRKNRYISFTPRAAYWKPGTALIEPHMKGVRAAIRVTLTDVDDYSSFNGQTRWVGPPQQYSDATHVSGRMLASQLQCTPYYRYWGDVDLLHIYGDAIVPHSTYAVQIVAEDCSGVLLNDSRFSPPAVIHTQPKWGDVIEPFAIANFQDVAGVVKAFQGKKGAPIKAAAQLQSNVPNPASSVNFLDVATSVSAFQGKLYSTMFAGPSACP